MLKNGNEILPEHVEPGDLIIGCSVDLERYWASGKYIQDVFVVLNVEHSKHLGPVIEYFSIENDFLDGVLKFSRSDYGKVSKFISQKKYAYRLYKSRKMA